MPSASESARYAEGHPNEALYGRDEMIEEFRKVLAELKENTAYLTSPTRYAFETGTVHGAVLGEKNDRRAYVVNVSSKDPAKASVKLPDGATLAVKLEPLEASVIDLSGKAKKAGTR